MPPYETGNGTWDLRAEFKDEPTMGVGIIKLMQCKLISGSMQMFQLHKNT